MRAVADDEAKRLQADADRRLRALNSSVVKGAKKQAARKTTPRRKRGQQGGATTGMALIVGCVGLFLWGFSHGSTRPDGKWLLSVLIVGGALAGFVYAGRRYRANERTAAEYTAEMEDRLQQDTTGAHLLDGA